LGQTNQAVLYINAFEYSYFPHPALAHEEIASYDPKYYETELIRAVESVLSPLGWDQKRVKRSLEDSQMMKLQPILSNYNTNSWSQS